MIPTDLSDKDVVAGSLLSQVSAAASPHTFLWSRWMDAALCFSDLDALEMHARIERWTLDEVALSGRLSDIDRAVGCGLRTVEHDLCADRARRRYNRRNTVIAPVTFEQCVRATSRHRSVSSALSQSRLSRPSGVTGRNRSTTPLRSASSCQGTRLL